MKRLSLLYAALLCLTALTAFSPAPIAPHSLAALTATLPNTDAPTPTSTVNPLTPTSETCYFNWATRPAPLLTERLRADIEAAGLTNVTVSASLFGEDCIDYNTNQVRSFGAMETDIRVTVTLRRYSDFSNRNFLGNLTAELLAIIAAAPPLDRQGPTGNRIQIIFSYGESSTFIRLSDDQAADLVERDMRGSALLAAVGWLSPAQMDGTATASAQLYLTPTTAFPPLAVTPLKP